MAIGVFNTITIDNTQILAPNEFELAREDVYKGEYTTCTGKVIADRIGWKYADMVLKWDYLPSTQLAKLTGLSGAVTLQFTDSDGSHSETIIRKGFTNMPTRLTALDGTAAWSNVEMEITFLNVH